MELDLGRRIATVVAVVLLVSACSPVAALGGGDSLVVTDDPMDAACMYQPLPGELDLDKLDMTLVWKAERREITTPILLEDLDRDGLVEVVFGLDNGRVISRELANNDTVLDIRPTQDAIEDLVVGNVDGDGDDELVFASAEGVYCYDHVQGEHRWKQSLEVLDAELHLVPVATLDGGLVKHDVIVLWSDGSYYLGVKFHVARYDGRGEMLWRSDLTPLLPGNGPTAACQVLDLNGDGNMEVFVNDYSETGIGFGGSSTNIWILDGTSGSRSWAMSVGQARLASGPVPLESDGSMLVAIGLQQDGTEACPDLLLYDGASRKHRLVDVSNHTGSHDWTFIAFAPDDDGGTVVMSAGWFIHSFSLDNPGVNGTYPSGSSGHDSPHVLCDIDDDGVMEILAPGGGVHIIDAESMQGEAQITQLRRGGGVASRATAIRLTVGDIDDDSRSEVVFGYYDDTGTQTSYIFYLGNLDLQDEGTNTGIAVGWGIVVFVFVANVLLIALLFRDWRRKGEKG